MNVEKPLKTMPARIERAPLCHLPTPLQPLDRLSAALGGPRLWIKRDDCTGLSLGGNKARKLEYVLPEALASGADTLITIGAMQSNHVRQTIAAGAKYGLESWVILGNWVGYEQPSYLKSGNRLLDDLLGAKVVEANADEAPEIGLQRLFESAKSAGRNPFLVELGASTPVGALGYANCAYEILDQCGSAGFEPSAVYFASGSGGTQAGLLAGMLSAQANTRVEGISVFNENGSELKQFVKEVCSGSLALLGVFSGVDSSCLLLNETMLGDGYGLPTDSMLEALQMVARLEAIILDPVYTGKAMAGLIEDVRSGRYRADENVVFIHTGGTPGLFAYADIINF